MRADSFLVLRRALGAQAGECRIPGKQRRALQRIKSCVAKHCSRHAATQISRQHLAHIPSYTVAQIAQV
jgi:hypothetical protein